MRSLLVLAMLSAFFVAAFSTHAEITLVADEWCPYNCEEDSDTPGFVVEAALAIFTEAGIPARYILLDDWDAAVEATRAGTYSAVIGATADDAPGFVFPEEPVSISSSCFFISADDAWRFSDPESLRSRKIAVIEGYAYGSEEIENDAFGNVTRFGSLEECVEAVLSGRCDTLVEDFYVWQLFEMKNYLTGQLIQANCLEKEEVFIAFSPANPQSGEWAAILSRGIAAMRASGEWAALLRKYGIQ